jgi:signal transduction histidine kinase
MKRLGISYDQLFHAVPGYYLVVQPHAPEYTIIEISDSLAALLGVSPGTLINQRLSAIFQRIGRQSKNNSAQGLVGAIRQVIATGEPCHVLLESHRPAGATAAEWHTGIFPIKHAGITAGIIVSIDPDKPYSAEDATDDHVRRLEHLIKINQSKDEFISIASHQLRTPATGVKQYLGMLREGMFGELSPAQKEILDRAYESNERQLVIVRDLLKVAQVDGGKVSLHFEGVDMNQLVQHVTQDSADVFKSRRQTLKYHAAKDRIIVSVDADTIRMVVENILDNASKYTEEGKCVEVRVRETKKSVKIRIADQGVGISTTEQSRLFEKFSRIENILSTKVGGTGLGLYWAKRVIDLHGGSITYAPNKPHGSIFEIVLPKETNL